MNKREIAVLACKVLGVSAIIAAFQLPVFGLMNILNKSDGGIWLPIISILTITLPLGAGVFLWARAEVLAAQMVRGEETGSEKPILIGDDIQAMAFSVVGLFFFVQGFPRFLSEIVHYATQGWPSSGFYARLFSGSFLQLVLAIALFFGGRGLVEIWKRIRGGGVPSPCKLPDRSA